jgi:hypothetical protein
LKIKNMPSGPFDGDSTIHEYLSLRPLSQGHETL